jgi:hypothetical protein
MVLLEAPVFRGDDSVLEIGRDLAEGDEGVALAIGLVVNPGLQAALDVHSGCGRVNPPGGHKGERGKRPKKRYSEAKPADIGEEGTLPGRVFGGCGWAFSHISG